MGVLIYNSSYSPILQCWIEKITETKIQRTVIQDLPTANQDFIQSLGTKNRTFDLNGGVSGSGVAQIRALPGTTGSFLAVDAWGTTMIPQTQVFFMDVKFSDDANSPLMRKFSLSTVEVV